MPEISDEDIRFVLSVDPDEESLNRALEQINAEIDRAKISKIRLELEQAWKPPDDVVPLTFWEKKFGKAGEALTNEFQQAAASLQDLRLGLDPQLLRERVEMERGLTEARKETERAQQAERVRQAGGLLQYTREKLGAVPDTTREKVAQERATARVRKEMEGAEHTERVKQAGGTMKYLWEQLTEAMGGGRGSLMTMLGGIMGGQRGGGMLGRLGGAAGAALGGPAGATVGEELAKAFPEKIAQPAKAATAAMTSLQTGLQGVQGTLGPVGAGLDLLSDGLNAVSDQVKNIPVLGELLGPLLDTFGKLPGVLKSVLETAAGLVSKVSPGVMKQFNIALEDAQATIGQAFLPVIQEMIPYIRELGTVIAQALPRDEEMREMFGSLFESIKDLVQELAPFIGPLMKVLVAHVKGFAVVMTHLATVFGVVTKAISALVKVLTFGLVDLGAVFGAGGAGKERQALSAARPAHLGSIEEYQRRLQLETFQSGRDTGMQTLPQSVSNIRTVLDKIRELFDKLMGPGYLVNVIAEGVSRLAADPAEVARGRDLDMKLAEARRKASERDPNIVW